MKRFLSKFAGEIVVCGCAIGFVGMFAALAFQWEGGLLLFAAGLMSMFLPMLGE